MNLFRSEDHVKGWRFYNDRSEESIMSVRDWAYATGAAVFRRRMDDDYLDHVEPYFEDFFDRLAELGRSGSFWR